MKEFVVPSLAIPVGSIWREMQEEITKERDFYVSSPLSSTPLPIYQWILEHANTFESWESVKFVLMDELVEGEKEPFSYIDINDAASYEGFAKKHLLDLLAERVGVTIPIVKPDLANLAAFDTPLDLLILAVGIDGNYANVMPGTVLETGWHVTHLTPAFRQAHTAITDAAYVGASFREYGMSLGHQQVLTSRKVVVIASGEKKKELVGRLKGYQAFDPDFPLSIIYHPDVVDRVELYLTPDTV